MKNTVERKDPEREARTIVGELREVLGYPITLGRIIGELPEEDRRLIRRVARAAREERQAVERAERAEEALGEDAPAERTRGRVFRFTG